MSSATFDTLTDWIGITVLIVAVGFLIAGDLVRFRERTRPKWLAWSTWVLATVFLAIVLIRFIRLA